MFHTQNGIVSIANYVFFSDKLRNLRKLIKNWSNSVLDCDLQVNQSIEFKPTVEMEQRENGINTNLGTLRRNLWQK